MFSRASYWRNVSPRGAIEDFVTVWRENPYRWRVLAVSILLSGTMLYGFLPESEHAPPERPEVTYITTFAPGRTDAQIMASNRENQARKEALAAQQAEREEVRREIYRAFGRAAGMDVERIEREAPEERARAQAAEEARRQALIDQAVADRPE